MASYKIQWKKSAIKELYNIHKDVIPRIITAIDSLAKNPRPSGVKKLSETEKTF
jgi:mRNA interferase RelE/StbE